jgi:DNA repair protein RecO (recombination protein O)
MSTEKTDAVLIRQADFGESSRVVTFFTRDWGKVSMVAKGGRRLKGPFEAALDLLTVSRIVFIRKLSNSLDILTEAQLVSRFRPNGRDMVSLYGGYYLAELLAGLTEEYDPHPVLFDQVVGTLSDLATEPHPKETVLRFELIVLREIGHLPAFDVCMACSQPVQRDGSYVFWVSQGGLICRNCQKEGYSQHFIQAGTIAVLQRLSEISDVSGQRMIISAQQFKEMRRIVTACFSHLLGHRPKLLRYIES